MEMIKTIDNVISVKGSYSNMENALSCITCPNDRYQDKIKQTRCKLKKICPAGKK